MTQKTLQEVLGRCCVALKESMMKIQVPSIKTLLIRSSQQNSDQQNTQPVLKNGTELQNNVAAFLLETYPDTLI